MSAPEPPRPSDQDEVIARLERLENRLERIEGLVLRLDALRRRGGPASFGG